MSILSRIETVGEITTIPPIKWMIEGHAKTGKSTHAMSWPRPLFLDLPDERGLKFLAGVERFPVETFADLRAVYGELRAADHGYKTIVLDTITALYSLCVRENFGDRQMRIQDYPKVYGQILPALDAFSSLGLHVVVISHVKAMMKEDRSGGGKGERVLDKFVNALPGQLSEQVAARMDHILHTKVGDDGAFRVLCRNKAMYEAGGRIKALPAVVEVPEGGSLFGILGDAFEGLSSPPDPGAETSDRVAQAVAARRSRANGRPVDEEARS